MSSDVLEKLKDDANYYGKFGRQFLSNSDIGMLLNDPRQFGKSRPDSKPLLEGRYFHTALLEPQKLKDFELVDCSTRNTKIYKDALEASGQEMLMLQSEADEILSLSQSMKHNLRFFESIYAPGNEYEVPGIQQIKGLTWKGKADIIMHSENMLIDIKTSGRLDEFKWSARRYNYDSQCYIYQMIFGKPLVFYVIEKGTHKLGIFNASEDFLRGGEQKVEKAVEVYNRFFSENSDEAVQNYYIEDIL
jgi:hypothetical protein